jgi:hypothetical protein
MGARSSPGAGETIHAAVAESGAGAGGCEAFRVSTRPRSVAVLLLSLLAGPVVLAGCGGDDEPESASSSATLEAGESQGGSAVGVPDDETAGDGSTDAPSFPADAEPDTADMSADTSVTVSDIRIGRHDGFDRVVFEVGGTGAPGWDVRYVDAASSQGSGDDIAVDGDAILQVTLTGAGYPYDTGVEEFSGGPVSSGDAEVVTEVVYDNTYEGTSVAFVGTTAQAPFRVYLLDNPTRVVLEVADRS